MRYISIILLLSFTVTPSYGGVGLQTTPIGTLADGSEVDGANKWWLLQMVAQAETVEGTPETIDSRSDGYRDGLAAGNIAKRKRTYKRWTMAGNAAGVIGFFLFPSSDLTLYSGLLAFAMHPVHWSISWTQTYKRKIMSLPDVREIQNNGEQYAGGFAEGFTEVYGRNEYFGEGAKDKLFTKTKIIIIGGVGAVIFGAVVWGFLYQLSTCTHCG